jgi:hypothetical protein
MGRTVMSEKTLLYKAENGNTREIVDTFAEMFHCGLGVC